jgi:hypothetical protein
MAGIFSPDTSDNPARPAIFHRFANSGENLLYNRARFNP